MSVAYADIVISAITEQRDVILVAQSLAGLTQHSQRFRLRCFPPSQPFELKLRPYGSATATRRTSTRWIVTPGADHVVDGGVAFRACSSVSNRRKPKPDGQPGPPSIRQRTLVRLALLARYL